jgi:predicted RNA-binding Zn-ribbon protein involved in translation (DUF1610 family)
MKRYSKSELSKFIRTREPAKSNDHSEPHTIIQCCKCGEAHKLTWHVSGDDQMYYVCPVCGFESEPLGLASERDKKWFAKLLTL